nr:hypothetical protein [Tanacetum cinerariifolium]
MKARVIIFSLLKNKKKLPLTLRTGSISRKIHALLLGGTTSYNNEEEATNGAYDADDDEDSKYPDLRHSLFDQEDDDDELGNPNASVIDLVKNSMENDGEDFSLEDEIDHSGSGIVVIVDFLGKTLASLRVRMRID